MPSLLERSFSNFEMSAPETKALPPAPVSTATRTAGSLLEAAASMARAAALSRRAARAPATTAEGCPAVRDVLISGGDPLTLSVSPSSVPAALGTYEVVLTAYDDKGASSSCTALPSSSVGP